MPVAGVAFVQVAAVCEVLDVGNVAQHGHLRAEHTYGFALALQNADPRVLLLHVCHGGWQVLRDVAAAHFRIPPAEILDVAVRLHGRVWRRHVGCDQGVCVPAAVVARPLLLALVLSAQLVGDHSFAPQVVAEFASRVLDVFAYARFHVRDARDQAVNRVAQKVDVRDPHATARAEDWKIDKGRVERVHAVALRGKAAKLLAHLHHGRAARHRVILIRVCQPEADLVVVADAVPFEPPLRLVGCVRDRVPEGRRPSLRDAVVEDDVATLGGAAK